MSETDFKEQAFEKIIKKLYFLIIFNWHNHYVISYL